MSSTETEATDPNENTEPDNANVGLIATVGIVGAFLVVSIAAALTALVRSEASSYGNEVGAFANLGTVQRLKTEQRAKLEAAPAYTDKSKGLVSVPIDRAMTAVTADLTKNPFLATPSPPEPPAAASPPADAGAETPKGAPEGVPSKHE